MIREITSNLNTLTVYLDGEIDHHGAGNLREQIDTAIRSELPEILVLDFSGVTFMDSSGIGLVIGRFKRISSIGGELIVTGCAEHIKKVMQMSGLDKLTGSERKELFL